MHTTKTIQNFTETELKKGVNISASWHQDYKDSAYVYIGGLNYDLNEGDIVIIFSQYGEIVDCKLMRDKKTGKSRGFAFLAYEDQRSTILAVDNFNGAEVCGRVLRVDHVKKFRPPRENLDVKEGEEDIDLEEKLYKPSGPDGRGWGPYRNWTEEELEAMKEEKVITAVKEEKIEKLYHDLQERKQKIIIDEDERWEKMLMKQLDDETVQERENKDLMKKVKKEMKKRRKLEQKLLKKNDNKAKKKKKDKEKEKNEQN